MICFVFFNVVVAWKILHCHKPVLSLQFTTNHVPHPPSPAEGPGLLCKSIPASMEPALHLRALWREVPGFSLTHPFVFLQCLQDNTAGTGEQNKGVCWAVMFHPSTGPMGIVSVPSVQ